MEGITTGVFARKNRVWSMAMGRRRERPPTVFGQFLIGAISRAGYANPTAWGEAVGLTDGQVSNLLCDMRSPPAAKVEQWAKTLRLSPRERLRFVALVGWAHAKKAAGPARDALLAAINLQFPEQPR